MSLPSKLLCNGKSQPTYSIFPSLDPLPRSRLDSLYFSVSQVHRHMSKCSLFDLLSVSSKPVTGQLSTISLEAGTTSVGHCTRHSETQLEHLLILKFIKGKLGKRNGILQSAVSIAPIFSGFLQAGIYDSLNGHAGIAGWRWLFGRFFLDPHVLLSHSVL